MSSVNNIEEIAIGMLLADGKRNPAGRGRECRKITRNPGQQD